jgi:hypothetical protein
LIAATNLPNKGTDFAEVFLRDARNAIAFFNSTLRTKDSIRARDRSICRVDVCASRRNKCCRHNKDPALTGPLQASLIRRYQWSDDFGEYGMGRTAERSL